MESDGIARLRARQQANEIDDIVIDHHGGHHEVCAVLPAGVGKRRVVNQHLFLRILRMPLAATSFRSRGNPRGGSPGSAGPGRECIFMTKAEGFSRAADAIGRLGSPLAEEERWPECAVLLSMEPCGNAGVKT